MSAANVSFEMNSSGKNVVFVNGHALQQGDEWTASCLAKDLGLEFYTFIDRRFVPYIRIEVPVCQ